MMVFQQKFMIIFMIELGIWAIRACPNFIMNGNECSLSRTDVLCQLWFQYLQILPPSCDFIGVTLACEDERHLRHTRWCWLQPTPCLITTTGKVSHQRASSHGASPGTRGMGTRRIWQPMPCSQVQRRQFASGWS